MRKLSDSFLANLLDGGMLSGIRKLVQSDTSLCLEIRDNYVNIYYRGGSMMKIGAANSEGQYLIEFDENYFRYTGKEELPSSKVQTENQVECWLASVPRLKRAMDSFLGKNPKEEREFQQRILRENNFGSIARSTDYYICDIEYQSKSSRFDMIALHWPSSPSERRMNWDRRLAFIEVKHGDNALEGSAGVRKHIEDINKFASNKESLKKLKGEMLDIFNQKMLLGLIDCGKDLVSFSEEEKPLLLLAFVNHDLESRNSARYFSQINCQIVLMSICASLQPPFLGTACTIREFTVFLKHGIDSVTTFTMGRRR